MLFELIAALPSAVVSQVQSVAFDGTSSTALLLDAATGRVLTAPKLYDEAQGPEAVAAAKVGGWGDRRTDRQAETGACWEWLRSWPMQAGTEGARQQLHWLPPR